MNNKWFAVAGIGVLLAVLGVSGQTASRQKPQARPEPVAAKSSAASPDITAQRALLDQYCVTCHNAKLKTANLLLDQLDVAHLAEHAEVAEKVVRKLRAGMMPPKGMKRPDAATLDGFVVSMENEV